MSSTGIGAVVLAAGRSRRMGKPKLVLPWGQYTIIEQVVRTLLAAGVQEITLVTGGARELVKQALANYPVQFTHNPDFETSEMLTSLQVGIRASSPALGALLVVLGDQPTMQKDVVAKIIAQYQQKRDRLVIPSYRMRRGHPWLVDRSLWEALLAVDPESTLRDFLQAHQQEIFYVPVDTPSILKDMDTPEDYQLQRPIQ